MNPQNYALTVLIPSGDTIQLPSSLLSSSSAGSHDDQYGLRQVIITSPTQLESAILDIDGRVDRGKRPNGNAWKSLTVWRAKEPTTDQTGIDIRHDVQDRENYGTLFYLRGCLYQEA
jgi:hypothetical protein